MEQRILTFTKRVVGVDSYNMNFDEVTKQLKDEGWTIKQIMSTSFNHYLRGQERPYPVLVVTILVERQ